MKKERRKHDAAVKAKVVLEVIRGQKTLSQISSEYGVHPNQITNWKRQFFQALPEVFSSKNQQREQNWEKEREELLKKIGQLEMERDWLQKKLNSFPLSRKRDL